MLCFSRLSITEMPICAETGQRAGARQETGKRSTERAPLMSRHLAPTTWSRGSARMMLPLVLSRQLGSRPPSQELPLLLLQETWRLDPEEAIAVVVVVWKRERDRVVGSGCCVVGIWGLRANSSGSLRIGHSTRCAGGHGQSAATMFGRAGERHSNRCFPVALDRCRRAN